MPDTPRTAADVFRWSVEVMLAARRETRADLCALLGLHPKTFDRKWAQLQNATFTPREVDIIAEHFDRTPTELLMGVVDVRRLPMPTNGARVTHRYPAVEVVS